MSDIARRKLAELVARFGRDLGDDPRRCEGLLRDVCGQSHKREIFVLVSAAREQVPAELQHASAGVPKKVLLARLAKHLQDHLGLSEELARWGVESWALALGTVADHELTPAATTRRKPAPGPAGPDELDILSEFPSVSAEEMLRQNLRVVLADGIVTDGERAEVKELCQSLGITPDVAGRILTEVRLELGLTQPGSGRTVPVSKSAPPPPAPNPLTSPTPSISVTPRAPSHHPGPPPAGSSVATEAMWYGIAAVPCVVFCFCIAPILGGVALSKAFQAKALIDKGQAPQSDMPKIIAAWVCGGIGVAFGLIMWVAVCASGLNS